MVHGSLINQVNFKMVKMKTSHIKRLTGHMYTEYDSIRCGPPSSHLSPEEYFIIFCFSRSDV